jgi:hypothetical protein
MYSMTGGALMYSTGAYIPTDSFTIFALTVQLPHVTPIRTIAVQLPVVLLSTRQVKG